MVKKPSKLYTNADIAAAETPPVTAATASRPVIASVDEAAASVDTATSEAKSGDAEGISAMPEEYWRSRSAFLRSEVDRGLGLLDAARRNPINSAQDQQLTDATVARAQGMLDGLKKQWAQLEAAIKDAKLPAEWIAPSPNFP